MIFDTPLHAKFHATEPCISTWMADETEDDDNSSSGSRNLVSWKGSQPRQPKWVESIKRMPNCQEPRAGGRKTKEKSLRASFCHELQNKNGHHTKPSRRHPKEDNIIRWDSKLFLLTTRMSTQADEAREEGSVCLLRCSTSAYVHIWEWRTMNKNDDHCTAYYYVCNNTNTCVLTQPIIK